MIILMEPGVELPSDLEGFMYTTTENWEVPVLRNLKNMGYAIGANKLL